MISKSELTFLKNLKKSKGLSDKQIEKDIENLIASQNGFNSIKSELKKTNNNSNKLKLTIKKLEEELKRKNKEIFNLKNKINMNIKEKTTRGNGVPSANVHQLKRILCLLDSEKCPVNKNYIFKSCMMTSNHGNSAITFLINHNMIQHKNGKYFVNK